MTTSISVSEDTKERLAESKGDDETWNELLNAMADEYDGESSDNYETINADELAANIADRVDGTGGVGPEQIAREVSKTLDYGMIASKVGEELEGRMQ